MGDMDIEGNGLESGCIEGGAGDTGREGLGFFAFEMNHAEGEGDDEQEEEREEENWDGGHEGGEEEGVGEGDDGIEDGENEQPKREDFQHEEKERDEGRARFGGLDLWIGSKIGVATVWTGGGMGIVLKIVIAVMTEEATAWRGGGLDEVVEDNERNKDECKDDFDGKNDEGDDNGAIFIEHGVEKPRADEVGEEENEKENDKN